MEISENGLVIKFGRCIGEFMVICQNCGYKFNCTYKYCPNCGHCASCDAY